MISATFEGTTPDDLKRLLDSVKGGAKTAMVRSLNDAIVTARKAGSAEIRKIYTIKAAVSKKHAKILRAKRGNLAASLKASGRMENAKSYKFSVRRPGRRGKRSPGKYGVFVSIKKGKRAFVRGAFVSPALHGNIFVRRGKPRLPIDAVAGPSVPQLYGNKTVVETMRDAGQERYEQRLRHHLGRLVEKS